MFVHNPNITDYQYNETGNCACQTQECVPLPSQQPPRPGKKQYLVVGDSVSMGYFSSLKESLQGGFDVVHAPGNNDNANWGRKCIKGWLGPDPSRWDVITFNHGLHDLAYPDNEHLDQQLYSKFLAEEIKVLQTNCPKAKLAWVATTPVPTNPPPQKGKDCTLIPGRLESQVLLYNQYAASTVAAAAGSAIPTIDIHSTITDYCGAGYAQCNITQCAGPHFSKEGFAMLGQAVAKAVSAL